MVDPKLRARNPSFEPVHRMTSVLSTGARRAMHRGHGERLEAVVRCLSVSSKAAEQCHVVSRRFLRCPPGGPRNDEGGRLL